MRALIATIVFLASVSSCGGEKKSDESNTASGKTLEIGK